LWRKEIHARGQRKKSERKEMQNYLFISFKIGFHVGLNFKTRRRVMTQKEENYKNMNHGESLKAK
jgi:hypothetical protein